MLEIAGVRWASGDVYEPYVGRWSRRVAVPFLAWLDAPPGLDWLDVGCGTGALVEAILARWAPERVAGIDPSAGFLDYAQRRINSGRVVLRRADAQSIPFEDASFDRVVSGLVLNFIPDKTKAVAEMARVTRLGGEVALYVWDYAGRMEMMRHFWDAATALDPAAAELDEGRRSAICRPGPLEALFERAELDQVATRAIEIPTVFRNFDDYWQPFLGGQAPAPAYCMSLRESARAALRERLREALPREPDGSIRLTARAWAVRGRKL